MKSRSTIGAHAAWAALLLAHLALPMVLSQRHADIPDEDAYQNLARNLATKGTYALDFASFYQRPGAPNSYFAPGWPAMLAAGNLIAGGPSGYWVVLGLVWCLALAASWRLATALGLSRGARWALAVWLTANPLYLYYHAHLMTEPLSIALGAGLIALGATFVQRPGWKVVIALGVLSGLAHLTRTALLLPVIATGVVAFATIPLRRLVPMGIVLIACHLAVVGPWLARMDRIGAGFRATELKLGINLFIFNNGRFENPYRPRPGETLGEPPGLEEMSPAARDATLTRLALWGIIARPGFYARNCLRRAWYLVCPWPNFSENSRAMVAALVATTLIFVWLPWGMCAVAIVRGARPICGQWVVVVALGLWYAFHILVHASMRQRLPSDVWVAALALSIWTGRGSESMRPSMR